MARRLGGIRGCYEEGPSPEGIDSQIQLLITFVDGQEFSRMIFHSVIAEELGTKLLQRRKSTAANINSLTFDSGWTKKPIGRTHTKVVYREGPLAIDDLIGRNSR